MSILMNSFQTPNPFVDSAMAYLTPEEYKCLSFACRHILGWQDKINKRRGVISLTMFERGFISAKGTAFGGTGLTRPTIVKAVDELVKYSFLFRIGEPSADGQEYELGEEPDFVGLELRHAAKADGRKQQTATARASKAHKPAGGLSDIPASGKADKPVLVNGTNQQQLTAQTSAGKADKLNQSHSSNPTKTNERNTDSFDANSNAKQWSDAMSQLELQLDAATFKAWLEGAQYVGEADGCWVIEAPRPNAVVVLQHRLGREIARVVRDVHGAAVELRYAMPSEVQHVHR